MAGYDDQEINNMLAGILDPNFVQESGNRTQPAPRRTAPRPAEPTDAQNKTEARSTSKSATPVPPAEDLRPEAAQNSCGSELVGSRAPHREESRSDIGSGPRRFGSNEPDIPPQQNRPIPPNRTPASFAPRGNTVRATEDGARFKRRVQEMPLPRVGSFVSFGRYPQNNGGYPEPVEWIVLDEDRPSGGVLLLSRYCLDCKPFHCNRVNVSWCDSDLRYLLNSSFLSRAFTLEERSQLIERRNRTEINRKYGTDGCRETSDRVFCLSLEEFCEYSQRLNGPDCSRSPQAAAGAAARVTEYAVMNGAYYEENNRAYLGNGWFWLRSPGRAADYAASGSSSGQPCFEGGVVNFAAYCIRPAIFLKKEALYGRL